MIEPDSRFEHSHTMTRVISNTGLGSTSSDDCRRLRYGSIPKQRLYVVIAAMCGAAVLTKSGAEAGMDDVLSAPRLALQHSNPSFFRLRKYSCFGGNGKIHDRLDLLLSTRGGVIEEEADEHDEYDLDKDEEEKVMVGHNMVDEETEDDDVDEEDTSLSASTMSSVEKARQRRANEAKKVITNIMEETSNKKKAKRVNRKKKHVLSSVWKAMRIPYIVRACLNPFTVMTMTKAYFSSLFNISYLEEDVSQTLRSALEAKAKKGGGPTGGRRGKRTMRPGQAKTLSDLPKLSA